MFDYLDSDGVAALWGKIDSSFVRKDDNETSELIEMTSGSVANTGVNGKTTAQKIEIHPESGSLSSVNLCFCGNNILPNPGTKTISGITYSYDSNGFLTVNGRATARSDYYWIGTSDTANGYGYLAPPGTYTFSLEKVSGEGSITLYMVKSGASGQGSGGTVVQIDEEGEEVYEHDAANARIMVRVANGSTIRNLKLKVQVSYGSGSYSYSAPYREIIPISLNGNTIGVDDKLVIDENGSCKIEKSGGSIVDLSGSYDFNKLKIPTFNVFDAARNSKAIITVTYYRIKEGSYPPSNSQIGKYLNGEVTDLIGNEPIAVYNLDVLKKYLGGTSNEPKNNLLLTASNFNLRTVRVLYNRTCTGEYTSPTFSVASSQGMSYSSGNIVFPKKCTAKITFTGTITTETGTQSYDIKREILARLTNASTHAVIGTYVIASYPKHEINEVKHTVKYSTNVSIPSNNTLVAVSFALQGSQSTYGSAFDFSGTINNLSISIEEV